METKVYKPSSTTLLFRRVIGLFFAFTGAGMGCTSMSVGLFFLLLLIGLEEVPAASWGLPLVFLGAGLMISVVFVGLGLMTAFRGRNDQVELTHQALNYTQGKGTTTMYLSDITGLSGQWRILPRKRYRGYWALLITDQLGHSIELDISQGGFLSTFEVLPILRDLIPRLPATVKIDPRIEAYMATGKMA